MPSISASRGDRTRAAASHASALCLVALAAVSACSSDPADATDSRNLGGSSGAGTGGESGSAEGGSSGLGTGGSIPTTGGSSGAGGTIPTGGSSGGSIPTTGGSSGNGGTDPCAAEKARAEALPVRLAFAFDESGSMGAHDFPWHDPALKWEPIFAATRAFFEDQESAGIEASLTVFPIGGEDWVAKCDGATYAAPNVPMTALPSTAFGDALEAALAAGWGSGTPTLAVTNGVLSYVASSVAAKPGRYAYVLVTDGYPQGCPDNSIQSVVDAVAAVADEIPTYVIGVANPPLTDASGNKAPETVMNLDAVAVAGGTEHAYIIDTGDPAATKAAFSAAIDEIRDASIACSFAIPPAPDGRSFERDKVAVTHTSGSDLRELTYDPTCATSGAWHYDDPDEPTEIVLCDATCAEVQGDRDAVIDVTFTCQSVIDPH